MSNVIQLYPKHKDNISEDMDVEAFRQDLIRPALKAANLWSESAENLLLGTALAESELQVVKQFGNGPAVSFFQIEPVTYEDIVKYLRRYDKRMLKEKILTACYIDIFPPTECLTWNIRLAVLIARTVYWRIPQPLPQANDVEAHAAYWKEHYNSNLGQGTIEHYLNIWRRYVT